MTDTSTIQSTLQSSGPDLGFILIWLAMGLAIFLVATALTAFVAGRMKHGSNTNRHE